MFAEARDQLVRSLNRTERIELLSSATPSRRVLDLDRISAGDFLFDRIGSGAADLVGLATGMDAALDRILTMFLRDAVASEGSRLDEIAEGMDALSKGMAKSLMENIEFGTEIAGIRRKAASISLLLDQKGEVEIDTARTRHLHTSLFCAAKRCGAACA